MKRSSLFVVLAAIAGCGGSEGGGGGGGAGSGTVTVNAYEGLAALPGATIVIHSRGGNVLETLTTGSDGTLALADVPLDGFVTALASFPGGRGEMRTIGGLADGDVFDVDLEPEEEADLPTVQMPVISVPVFAGAASYVIDAGACELNLAGGTSGELAITDACMDATGDADLLAIALSDAGVPLAHSSDLAVDIASNPTIAMPAWSTAFDTAAVSVAGLPEAATVGIGDVALRGRGGLYEVILEAAASVEDGEFATTKLLPPALSGPYKRVNGVLLAEDETLIGATVRWEEEDTLTEDVVLNFSMDFLPGIVDLADVSEDVRRPELEWTAGFGPLDVVVARAEWAGAIDWNWELLLPPEAADGTIRFPELPQEVLDDIPAVAPGIAILAGESDFIEGFEEMKDLPRDFDIESPETSPALTRVTIGGAAFFD